MTMGLLAQNFSASANAEEVLEGYDFQVTFTLDGAKGTSFQPPSFEGFTVVGGPSTSTSMSIVNGRTSQSMSFTYALMPKSSGQKRIGSASIKVGGNTLRTKPLNIKVLKGSEQKKQSSDGADVFLEVELSDSVAYVGQQVILKYVIYTAVDVRSYNFLNESEYDGFYPEELKNYREKAVKVVRNGRQYLRQPLKVLALFPQQTGRTEIGPALVNIGIAVKSDRPSFFFSTSMKSERMTTPAKIINVLPSPRGAPTSFSGGIGNFQMRATIDRNTVSQDGAVTMTMTIQGDGDARFVGPPQQNFDGFEIYDPNLLDEKSRMSQGKVNSTKVYEYLLVPQDKGLKRITPEFSFYNVDSARYITLSGGSYNIRVVPGSGNKEISTERLSKRMAPIVTTTNLFTPSKPLFSWWHLGSLGMILLGFVAVAAVKWNDDRIAKIDPLLLKANKAQKVAIAKLSEAKSHLDSGNIREFYQSLINCLFSYLSDKLAISANSISKDNLTEIFQDTSVSSEIAENIKSIIQRSEMAIYARKSPEEAQNDYEESRKVIVEIENILKEG